VTRRALIEVAGVATRKARTGPNLGPLLTQAHRHREGAETADGKDCPDKGGIKDWLYTPSPEASLHPL